MGGRQEWPDVGPANPSARGLGFAGPAASSASLFRAAPPSSKAAAEFPSLGRGNAGKGKAEPGKETGFGASRGGGMGDGGWRMGRVARTGCDAGWGGVGTRC